MAAALSEALFEELLFEELFDVCAETHFQLFRDAKRPPPSPALLRDTGFITARCRVCGEMVGTKRFTIHLSKCMRGGRRGTGEIRKTAAQNFELEFRNYAAFKRKSCNIVRISLENGGECIYLDSDLDNDVTSSKAKATTTSGIFCRVLPRQTARRHSNRRRCKFTHRIQLKYLGSAEH